MGFILLACVLEWRLAGWGLLGQCGGACWRGGDANGGLGLAGLDAVPVRGVGEGCGRAI
jgi:hypothetical protein